MSPVPDHLKFILKDSEFSTSNWTNRRFIVKSALLYCMIAFSFIVIAVITLMYIKPEYRYDQNLTSILSTALTTLGFLTISIIGSYVFGAQWDTNSYRNSVSTIVSPNSNNNTNNMNSPIINNLDNDIDPDSLSMDNTKSKRSRIRRTDNFSNSAKG